MLHDIHQISYEPSPKEPKHRGHVARIRQVGSKIPPQRRETQTLLTLGARIIVKARPPLIGRIFAQSYRCQHIPISPVIPGSPIYQLTMSIIKQSTTSSLDFQETLYLSPSPYNIKGKESQKQRYASSNTTQALSSSLHSFYSSRY